MRLNANIILCEKNHNDQVCALRAARASALRGRRAVGDVRRDDFWKAHHSSADQKAANDVTLVLLKKNLQFLIDNAATLQDTLGVNFLDPGLQMDLLVRVGYNRRHLHRKLTGTEQEQKWKSLVAAGINTDWPKVLGKDVSIAAWEHFLAQFWFAGNFEAGKLQAHKRADKPKVDPATPMKQGVTPGDAKTSSEVPK